ncbi:MAG: DUF2796 domain-containing protein [Pseudomonadota bacterium]
MGKFAKVLLFSSAFSLIAAAANAESEHEDHHDHDDDHHEHSDHKGHDDHSEHDDHHDHENETEHEHEHDQDEDSARSHGAHTHGAWELFAALDGSKLSLTAKGPLVDVLGFEYAPKTNEERQSVEALVNRLETPEVMIALDGRGQCALSSPVAVSLPDGFLGENEHDGDDDHTEQHHHDADHADPDIHANDLEISYQFECDAPKRLGSITVSAFEAFPSIERVDSVFLSGTAQAAERLSPDAQTLKLKK